MCDVDEIIDYIKSLKRGFDKDLFQSKIDELAQAVDTVGLEYEDFHTLFKVWLNLSIPITKWTSIGVCLVPQSSVTEQTIDYALRWLLSNGHNQASFTRTAFVLDWLTAAMDCESIDITALDYGYEVYFSFLTYETLAAHASKLVYTLTKPADVTRVRVLELIHYVKKREGKKSMCRQLQVLLGLFKSYKPELVPENIPAIPVHSTFKSNITLLTRFKRCEDQRDSIINQTKMNHLMWTNPMLGVKNKKAESLVPTIEFLNIGSQQYADKGPQKNYLDFTDPVSLLQYGARRCVSRPARLRALLRHPAGLVLLALSAGRDRAALQLDLHHVLPPCFFDASPYSEAEKCDFLHRIAALQRVLSRPLRAVTAFLAHWLPLWDETRYFGEILELVEWVDPENPVLLDQIVVSLTEALQRATPARQAAILRALSTMYSNLIYSSTRSRHESEYIEVARCAAEAIHAACGLQLQADPEDFRVLYSSVQAARRMGEAELRARRGLGGLPAPATLALALLAPSAALPDHAAGLVRLYKKIIFSSQESKKKEKDDRYLECKQVLRGYTSDLIRCLAEDSAFSGRQDGYLFQHIHPQVTENLSQCIPDVDSALSLRNHLAFAPHIYVHLQTPTNLDNEVIFETVINKEFTHLSKLLSKLCFSKKMVT